MNILSSARKFPSKVIGDVIITYTRRWLHKTPQSSSSSSLQDKNRQVLAKIAVLIPPGRDSVPISFLLRLLKASNRLNSSMATKIDLTRRAGLQLGEAEVTDLLIPSVSTETTDTTLIYDVDLVMMMVEEFLLSHLEIREPITRVANIIDNYLIEVAKDANLPIIKFVNLVEAIPNYARLNHDNLYHAIDIFLKVRRSIDR